MEHESFEDPEVARSLNEKFVSIKLDREERPDVDDVYMTAVQSLTGQGGWPLSVFLTPRGEPFFGGTYFPRGQFLRLLDRIFEIWKSEPAQITQDALRLTEFIAKGSTIGRKNGDSVETLTLEPLTRLGKQLIQSFDSVHGGYGAAPKFPPSLSLLTLLRAAPLEHEEHIRHTLEKMMKGGIYDHLRGGFHRYSTDEAWVVPHFEKMLYDNAFLAMTFLEAGVVYKQEEFKLVASEILDYVLREMTHPLGGFFSAQDADSLNPTNGEKEEGYFCTYSFQELKEELSPSEFEILSHHFVINEEGDLDGRIVLRLKPETPFSFKASQQFKPLKLKLESLRAKRPAPHLDDKILVSWNGWMISAFVKGSQALQREDYFQAAIRASEFLRHNLFPRHSLEVLPDLCRRWREGEAAIGAGADDYASFVSALLDIFEESSDESHVLFARQLQRRMDELFWDPAEGGYFRDDGKDTLLLARLKEDYDGVYPTSNSIAVDNHLRMFDFFGETEFRDRAEKILKLFNFRLHRFPQALAWMLSGLYSYHQARKQLVVVCPDETTLKEMKQWRSHLVKNPGLRIFVLIEERAKNSQLPLFQAKSCIDRQVTFYSCEGFSCLRPTVKREDINAWISSF